MPVMNYGAKTAQIDIFQKIVPQPRAVFLAFPELWMDAQNKFMVKRKITASESGRPGRFLRRARIHKFEIFSGLPPKNHVNQRADLLTGSADIQSAGQRSDVIRSFIPIRYDDFMRQPQHVQIKRPGISKRNAVSLGVVYAPDFPFAHGSDIDARPMRIILLRDFLKIHLGFPSYPLPPRPPIQRRTLAALGTKHGTRFLYAA